MPPLPRTPTDDEYAAYDGMHCRNLWAQTGHDWRCPACGRTKRQIMVWGKRKGVNARIFGEEGWKCGLHKHHDHASDYGLAERFPSVVICNGCNAAEGKARTMVGAPLHFSFSSDEMSRFINATPHGPARVDFTVLASVYRAITSR